MKLFLFINAICLNLLFAFAYADVDLDEQNVGSERIKQVTQSTPFSFQTHFDSVGKTKVDKHLHKGDKVTFGESEIVIGSVIYYEARFKEGLRMSLGYTATKLQWHNNPYYDQNHFNTLSLNIAGFTARFDKWFWRSQISINTDTDEWSLPYTNYDLILWGRYEYCKHIGVHFGLWVQTGMRLDRVYPIIGADWQISPKWKLNLVYPVNVSLQYTLTPTWSLAFAGRSFDSRQRLNKHSSHHKALIRYQNIGAEFSLMYHARNMTGNVHVGSTVGGKYRIASRHNRHAENLDLQPAAYAGGEVDVSF